MGTINRFEKTRDLFLAGVIDALANAGPYFESMERTARGNIPVNGLALDVCPWDGWANLALRTQSVPNDERYAIADWPDFDFANHDTSTKLKEAADFAADCYRNKPDSMELIHAAHMILLAAAEALLDSAVATKLQESGIDAPYFGEGVSGSSFEYLVLDVDENCRANYCEIVKANRTTARFLDVWNGNG